MKHLLSENYLDFSEKEEENKKNGLPLTSAVSVLQCVRLLK